MQRKSGDAESASISIAATPFLHPPDFQAAALRNVYWGEASLVGIQRIRVRDLSGFIRGKHSVPKRASMASDAFVQSISSMEQESLEAWLRTAILSELEYERWATCSPGRISTPDFECYWGISVDSDKPSEALLRFEITHFQSGTRPSERQLSSLPSWMLDPRFEASIGAKISKVEVRLSATIELPALAKASRTLGLIVCRNDEVEPEKLDLIDVTSDIRISIRRRGLEFSSLRHRTTPQLLDDLGRCLWRLAQEGLPLLPALARISEKSSTHGTR